MTYTQLFVAARKAEAEVIHGKSETMTIKAKAVTENDALVSLKQQVSDLVAVVKANQVQGKPEGTTIQQNSSNNRNQANKGPLLFGGASQQSSTAGPSKIINQHVNIIIAGHGATWQKNVLWL